MNDFEYEPDREQKIHTAGAIALLCKPFQSHESGLPEWVKNSADAYSRANVSEDRRIIVVIFGDAGDGLFQSTTSRSIIACLDFVGMKSEVIEKHFRHWASPDAAMQSTSANVQGGHGNGGKCYMTQMFKSYSYILTVRDGMGCRYGVAGASSNFGYMPSRPKGKDFAVPQIENFLRDSLIDIGVSIESLPAPAIAAIRVCAGFTLVVGVDPKHFAGKNAVADLVDQLQDHPQMQTTLQYCKVFAVRNGKALANGALAPSAIEPIDGYDAPRRTEVPAHLVDPVTNRNVPILPCRGDVAGELVLRTSKTKLNYRKKTRHVIAYRTSAGFVGYRSMLEFDVQSAYRDKIYGECYLEALDPFKQNDRGALAESPLTRAVEKFISDQLTEYALEFEKNDRRSYSHKERNALSQINSALDRWKNQFLKQMLAGAFGAGGGSNTHKPLPEGVPVRLSLDLPYSHMGIGVAIRPRLHFFDKKGQPVRSVPYQWVSENANVALVDNDLMLITSFAAGDTVIYAETLDGRLRSERCPLHVIRIREIDLLPREIELPAGSRRQVVARCTLSSGEVHDEVALVWTESNAGVARVSAGGMLFGASPGVTEIIAGDDTVTSDAPAMVTVTDGSGSGTGKGKGGRGSHGRSTGRGYPLILVSGVDADPDSGSQVDFAADEPPITQRPQDFDRNIWWINSSAPLARLYLNKEAGYGYESREWRMYHLERYVEIIAQIAVLYDPNVPEALPKREMFQEVAAKIAEIQATVADELSLFIASGSLPPE